MKEDSKNIFYYLYKACMKCKDTKHAMGSNCAKPKFEIPFNIKGIAHVEELHAERIIEKKRIDVMVGLNMICSPTRILTKRYFGKNATHLFAMRGRFLRMRIMRECSLCLHKKALPPAWKGFRISGVRLREPK